MSHTPFTIYHWTIFLFLFSLLCLLGVLITNDSTQLRGRRLEVQSPESKYQGLNKEKKGEIIEKMALAGGDSSLKAHTLFHLPS